MYISENFLSVHQCGTAMTRDKHEGRLAGSIVEKRIEKKMDTHLPHTKSFPAQNKLRSYQDEAYRIDSGNKISLPMIIIG